MEFQFERTRIDKIPKETVLAQLERVAELRGFVEFGKREFDETAPINSSTAVRAFGTWSKAMAAGETLQKQAIRQGTARNPRDVPPGLRLTVYERDRFRCIYCERSPITDLTVELHADHIVPFVRGGQTVLANLQTLCAQCNLGKGSRDDVRHPSV